VTTGYETPLLILSNPNGSNRFNGATAEFIMEKPNGNELPYFDYTQFDWGLAWDTSGNQRSVFTDYYLFLDGVSSTDQVAHAFYPGEADSDTQNGFTIYWENYQ
jgi:hypothetical protein